MPVRIYNGTGFGDDAAYRDLHRYERMTTRRPATPVLTDDWNTALAYGEQWGPEIAKEHKYARARMFLSGLGFDEATIGPDVTVTEMSIKDRPFKLDDPKSWLSDHELVEKEYDKGWTIRRLYDMELRPEAGDIRHDVALAVGRLVLTGRGKFLFLGDHGIAGTDEQYRLDSLLQDPVRVASFRPRKSSDWLDMQLLRHYRDRRFPTAKTQRTRAIDPAFTRMDYRAAVITPEKIAKGRMEDMTPRMVIGGLRDFLKRYRMIRQSA